MKPLSIAVIGGGAAGFFGAITAKKANPQTQVILFEKTAQLLSKVKISGGGRCNVTHACFDPKKLAQNYPRGNKELIGPFSRFQPLDTIQWFESRGVQLKTEEDGRMFPVTDSSQTIIDCLLLEAQKLGVEIRLKQKLETIEKRGDRFHLTFATGSPFEADKLLLATGSSPQGFQWAQNLGHTIQEPVPSLFTFNVPQSPLHDLAGIAMRDVHLHIKDNRSLFQQGPLLITHWGFSGPAALKLSAWGARYFSEKQYQCTLIVNWLPAHTKESIIEKLHLLRKAHPNRAIINEIPFEIPKGLWKRFLEVVHIDGNKKLAALSNAECHQLTDYLHEANYFVNGRTTYKEEFVTCGGITLKEVDFKKMESRLCDNLFFAGEILDIDGITGGFNFQNAWTTSWIAGNAMV